MRRTQVRWRAAPALLVVVSVCRVGMAAPAAAQSQAVAVSVAPPVAPKVFKGDVRHLPAIPPKPLEGLQRSRPVFRKSGGPGPRLPEALAAVAAMPAPIQTFAGLSLRGSCGTSQCGAGFPPDPVGDVGPNHYVQGVNTAVGIYSKTGTQLAAFTFDALWAGANTGTACDANNAGDPTVIYDPLADRWFVADLGFTDFSTPPFYECIAVSMSGDPVSGGWYLYAIRADDAAHAYFPDYPKMGIWPDGLYMTANEFEGNTYREVRIWAFDRVGMEAGQPVQSVIVDTNDASLFSMLPANWRGTPPPPGTPNYLVVQDPTLFRYDVYKFHVDWATPANSTFTGPTRVTQGTYGPPYTTSFSTDIVPQSGTSTKLDSLGDQLMMQAQYRNIGGVESLWVVHTVRPSGTTTGPTGVQWAQLDVTGSTIAASPVQEQIFTNGDDGLYRWIPSIAVDGSGNAALGYSASNATSFPSIRYAGRLVTDPLGTMGQGETTLFAGTGSQKFTCGGPCSRWGDYSAMTVDPVDDCTFWYVNEYYVTTGSSDWQTRIGSFRFPSCVSLTPTPAPTATPTRTPTFTPTATATPTVTPTPTASPTQSSTPTATPTPTRTPTPTATASATATATNTATPAWTATATATATNTATITPTATATTSHTPTATATGTATSTGTATPTATATNTPTPTATATSGPTCSLCGDANGDGSVDIVDALFIAQLTVDRRPTLACPNRADVNGDAAVTIVDALFISQYIVDLRSALDCGGPG